MPFRPCKIFQIPMVEITVFCILICSNIDSFAEECNYHTLNSMLTLINSYQICPTAIVLENVNPYTSIELFHSVAEMQRTGSLQQGTADSFWQWFQLSCWVNQINQPLWYSECFTGKKKRFQPKIMFFKHLCIRKITGIARH